MLKLSAIQLIFAKLKREKYMKNQTLLSIIWLFFLLASGTASAFTDAELRELLNKVDTAANHRDVATIGSLLSDSVKISIEMPTPQGAMQMNLTKEEYLKILKQGWDTVGKSYKYSRISTEIKNNGNTAQVVSVIKEEFQVKGKAINSESLEISDYSEENGKLVAVKIFGRTYIEGQSIPKPSI